MKKLLLTITLLIISTSCFCQVESWATTIKYIEKNVSELTWEKNLNQMKFTTMNIISLLRLEPN